MTPTPSRVRRAALVFIIIGGCVLAACSDDPSRGEGFLFIEGELLLLCESIEAESPARCVDLIFGVDSYLVLANGSVEMVDDGAVRYSVERVELVQADPDVAAFEAIPVATDE